MDTPTRTKRRRLRWTSVTAAALAGVIFAIAGASIASSVDVSVADVDAPTGSVTLAPGDTGNLNIQITITGNQAGTATFKVNKTWSLSGGVWTGSNPEEFTVSPRAGGDPATVFNRSGTVSVAAGQADGTFPLTVPVFDITNSNATGAKLTAGNAGNYSVTVATPAPSDTQAPQNVSISINSGAAWTTDANGDVTLALSSTDDVGVASYKLATSQADLAGASSHAVSPTEATFSRSNVPFTLSSGEGAAKEVWFQACDAIGNCTSDKDTIGWDKTAPSIGFVSRTAANANGWNSGDVTVTWSCSDDLSGTVAASISNTVSSEGANQSSTGTCHDQAGNSASDTQSGINIDTTAPTITLISRTPANGAGWNNGDVTLMWSCVDPLSGPVAATVSDTITTEGVGQSSTGTCHDNAGNNASDTQTGIQIDKTAPGLTWSGGPADGASYYFGSVPAAPTCSASDALSGPNGCNVTGYSSAVGSYTLTATAHDVAGNENVETRTYTVLAWTISGFYQPVDMGGVWNTVKNGSTVPLKFEVFSGATELTDTAVVNQPLRATQTPCAGGTTDDVELLSSGLTALRYDATGGQFIYNWQTPKKVGYCYIVTVTTADGSSISANFKLK